ncbi:MAG: hypothetical protein ACP5I6_01870 [Caldisphaera sp.]|jgi:hypothetical protein
MTELSFDVESTKSKTGLHAMRKIVVLIKKGKEIETIANPSKDDKGTYKKGKAGKVTLRLNINEYAVHVTLVKNPKNRIKGRLKVYNCDAQEVLEVKYEKLKIRRSWGDPSYAWIIDKAIDVLGLTNYVRRKNYGTGQLKEPPKFT